MFVHQTKLEPLLKPADYVSREAFVNERALLFPHHWQIVGFAHQVANEGEYLACDVGGIPVIVHKTGGSIGGFRNACAHRNAMLRPNGSGKQTRLTCQYHGWQYDGAGKLCKVPDGQSFKGIKSEDFCLTRVSTEVCGPFLLASLNPKASSFRDHLGAFSDEFDAYFGHHRLFGTWQTEHAVNWKVIIENAVESYHVPLVHPTTFRQYKPPELHDHTLAPTYSRYADLQPWDNSIVSNGFRVLAKSLLKNPNLERFKHTHIYPNHLLYYGDLISTWTTVEAIDPARSRYTLSAFVPRDLKKGMVGRLLQSLSSEILLKQFKRILREDMDLWPKIQSGLSGSLNSGVLSCREERIWAFQKYLTEFRQNDAIGQPS